MTTLEKLIEQRVALRKDADKKHLTPFIGLAISECERVGKDKDNRVSTEDEVQAVLTKLMKSINESISYAKDQAQIDSLTEERDYLAQFLPEKVDDNVLREFITVECVGMNIGQAMGVIKKKFGSAADMKLAAKLVKEVQ